MSLHAMSRSLSLALMLLAVSCGKDDNSAFAPDPESREPPDAVVVSNVIGPVSYVSLLPGAIPHGATVLVRNMTSGAETTAALLDGGADPIGVTGLEGNALRIVATDSAGASYIYITLMKRRARPRVVRTDPAPQKTAVPLNAVIRVVFSEPVDLPSVESSVHVRQASGPVAGTVRLVDGSPGVVDFVPADPLAQGTNYALDIGAGVLDLDGDPLLAAVTVPFTTSGSAPPTVPLPGVGVARLRVVHATPGRGDLDVLIDRIEVVSDLPYLAATDYLDVTPGVHDVWNSNGEDYSWNFEAGVEYTALPCCERFPGGNLLVDDNREPPAGQARIRFVDYASVSNSVLIYLAAPGADLATAVPIPVDIGWATDYFLVPAGDYQIRITPWDSDVVAMDSGPLTLLAGQVRTVIAVDAPGGGEPHDFLILKDLH